MKTLGLFLIFGAFLAGAFLSVLDPRTIEWPPMALCLAAGVAGLVIFRRAAHAAAHEDAVLSGNIRSLADCLGRIREGLESLAAAEELPTYEARFEIDRLFRSDLEAFAEARESMVHVFGMQDYADVMSHFAAGERYLNRVWSASTDGYVDEVRLYLLRAREQFRDAEAHFQDVQRRHGGEPVVQSMV